MRWIILMFLSVVCGAQTTLPAAYFGNDYRLASNIGTVASSSYRLMDTGTLWCQINTAASTYVWTTFDGYVSAAKTNGATVLLDTSCTPSFISSNPTDSSCTGSFPANLGGCDPPSDIGTTDATWKAYITALVTHWTATQPGVTHYYEIWNEPNANSTYTSGSRNWTGTVAQLETMTADAYAIIHANDPNGIVVSPCPDLTIATWFASFFTAGGGSVVDAVAFHFYPNPYNLNGSPYTSPEVYLYAIAQLKAAMVTASVSKPLYVTEGNWYQLTNLTPLQEASFMVKWHMELLSAGASNVWWYQVDNTIGGSGSCSAEWGRMWDSSLGICQAGTTYTWLQSYLVNATYSTAANQPCSNGGDDTWSCLFTTSGGAMIQFLWNEGQAKSIGVSSQFIHCYNMDSSTCTITGHTASIGSNPILLTTN